MLHVLRFKFPEEYPVPAACFHDYAGGAMLGNNLVYMEQVASYLQVL